MSDPSYTVEVAATAKNELERLSDDEQAEVLTTLQKLAHHPLPGGRSGVIRMRGRSAPVQPLFYSRTQRFGIYHTVTENRVIVLVIVERPRLELTQE